MKIKSFNEYTKLMEASKQTYDYACAMVYVKFPMLEVIQEFIESDDVYTEEGDSTYGLETEPHITLLYGLHEEVNSEDIFETIKQFEFQPIKLTKVSSFGNEKYDVLKFTVDSNVLHNINGALTKFPHTTSFPDYNPHLTIGYLKPGMAKAYIDVFSDLTYLLDPYKIVYSHPTLPKAEFII